MRLASGHQQSWCCSASAASVTLSRCHTFNVITVVADGTMHNLSALCAWHIHSRSIDASVNIYTLPVLLKMTMGAGLWRCCERRAWQAWRPLLPAGSSAMPMQLLSPSLLFPTPLYPSTPTPQVSHAQHLCCDCGMHLSASAARLIFACICVLRATLSSHLMEAGPPDRRELCCLREIIPSYSATVFMVGLLS